MSFIETLLGFFMPWKSSKWVMWKAYLDLKTCVECKELHGKSSDCSGLFLFLKRFKKFHLYLLCDQSILITAGEK